MKNGRKKTFGDKRKRNFKHSNKKTGSSNRPRRRYRGKRGGSDRVQKLRPDMFIKKAKPLKETVYIPQRKYADINLHADLQNALAKINFLMPTEIQDKTIEANLQGKNILGIADTGTGKTGAFLIPLIDRLLKSEKQFNTLILAPTRELAIQIQKDLFEITQGLGIFSITLVGGSPAWKDIKKLERNNHFIIGTPGRVMDMIRKKAYKLEKTEVLVLDEFDRMLDMGFVDDMRFIIGEMNNLKQKMLFSATINKKIQPIIDEIVPNPFKVMVGTMGKTSENVEQNVIRLEHGETKFNKLFEMLQTDALAKTIIFAETKHSVKKLYRNLRDSKIKVECLHGDKDQRSRNRALGKFKDGLANVMIATDVAARGLDIKDVTHVINFEMPRDYDSYIHRIGRTGRNGKLGHAFTFVD